MKALLWAVLAATGLWTGYWWVGASSIESAVQSWFAENASLASTSGVEVHGIPNRFDLTVNDVVWSDTAQGITVKSPFAQVYAMTWKPWHVIAALPSGQEITLPDQKITVGSDSLRASLELHPSTALGLRETVVEAKALSLTSDLGWTVSVEDARFATLEDPTPANTHRLGVAIANITPAASVMQALASTDLPPKLAEIYLDAHATLSAPLDRFASETHPQLLALHLTEARMIWGALKFTASGALTARSDGIAEGEIALRAEGWRRLPPVLVALGLVKPDIAPTVERMLEVIAAQSPDLDVINITLSCQDGRMSLGPLPLGPAPRLH